MLPDIEELAQVYVKKEPKHSEGDYIIGLFKINKWLNYNMRSVLQIMRYLIKFPQIKVKGQFLCVCFFLSKFDVIGYIPDTLEHNETMDGVRYELNIEFCKFRNVARNYYMDIQSSYTDPSKTLKID